MDYLWTPWRYQYIKNADKEAHCIFCRALEMSDDEEALILHRGKLNFVILNRFPYTSGHLMIAPFAHGGEFSALPGETLSEMMLLAQRAQRAMAETYQPYGFNLGMNLGRAAGAGVTDHVHLHVLPRWPGDASFMTTVGETRIEPEDLTTTYRRLRPHFEQ